MIAADWRADAEVWAQEHYPREACGLVVVVKGRERFHRCRNDAEGNDHFIINHHDFAAAEDAGEVVAIWHSHCNTTAEPSEADRVSCEQTGLPWHIYALPLGQWLTFQPTGYKAPLIGRQFFHGVLDCYALIRDWYAEERGIELPDYQRTDDWWHKGQNLYLDNFQHAGFRAVDTVQHGDVLLLQISSPVPNHAGIWLDGDFIVHHIEGRLSSKDVYGGYFRKHTVKILRHGTIT